MRVYKHVLFVTRLLPLEWIRFEVLVGLSHLAHYTYWKSLILIWKYFSTVMVKSRKPFLWIEELAHLKQGLFLSMEDQRPPSSPVSVSKNTRKTASGRHMGWVQEDSVARRPAGGAVMLNLYLSHLADSKARAPSELFLSEEPSGGRCWRGQCAEFPFLLSTLTILVLEKCPEILDFDFLLFAHFQTLWENQALVVSTRENPTSYRGSLKYWRHILGRGSTSPSRSWSRSFILLLWKSSMFIMKWNETFC